VLSRPDALNLSNWRQPHNNRWAFHHVREIVPSEDIPRGASVSVFDKSIVDGVSGVSVPGPGGEDWSLQDWLEVSNSDALLVAHKGKIVHEWYVDAAIETSPHIVFSVSKSVTAILAGVLVEQGLLDPAKPLLKYIPELADSGYRDASLQQLLDMVVNIDFNEDYLATSGKFVEYRTATAWHPCGVDAIDQNLHDFLCSLERTDGEHGQVWRYRSPNSDLDRKGAPRTAGGICVLPRDLLRFGELVRNRGYANGQQVVPERWIEDCSDGGSLDAWERGESAKEFPAGSYRNKWYQTGNEHRVMLAIGIHSQWIYINPVTEVTIVKLSSQDEPLRLDLDNTNMQAFTNVSDVLAR